MKTRRKWCPFVFCLFALVLSVFLCGCSENAQKTEEKIEEKSNKLQIGMSFDSFVIERWLRDRDQFELTAKDLGAEVNVQVANGDVDNQISQIQYFIQKGMDVIVVIAVDGSALQDVIKEAKNKGIRIVCYDRLLVKSNTDLYISFDNEKVGTLMAEAMKNALPDGGSIFAIHGSPTDYNVSQVEKGFNEGIEGSNLSIVYQNYCENWLAELAFDYVEEGLAKNPRNIKGVMCGNDDLASQAFKALSENRLAGKVVLVGQDADLSACQRIVEGTQYMTVHKPIEQLAQKAAEFACALGYQKMFSEDRISENELPENYEEIRQKLGSLETIDDGAYEVPYMALEPIAVTAENMDKVIIESGFHAEKDVYLNVKKRE